MEDGGGGGSKHIKTKKASYTHVLQLLFLIKQSMSKIQHAIFLSPCTNKIEMISFNLS